MACDPATAALVCGILGLLVGSFLNVVIHRLPQMMERDWAQQCAELRNEAPPEFEPLTLARPRSRCPQCGHGITAMENIPIFSYLLLSGRCRQCRARISMRYPIVEAVTGLLFSYAGWRFGLGWQTAGALFFIAAAIALSCIDFDTQLLPDDITQPLLWAGLMFNLSGAFANLTSAVIGAVAGYLSLWSIYWMFKLATGKEGMGYGDFKLLAAIGAWVGWQVLPITILISSFLGAVVGIALIVFARHGRNVPIPFGPYLAGAGVLALFWGKPMTQAYLGSLVT